MGGVGRNVILRFLVTLFSIWVFILCVFPVLQFIDSGRLLLPYISINKSKLLALFATKPLGIDLVHRLQGGVGITAVVSFTLKSCMSSKLRNVSVRNI